jgi:hypothetical protein
MERKQAEDCSFASRPKQGNKPLRLCSVAQDCKDFPLDGLKGMHCPNSWRLHPPQEQAASPQTTQLGTLGRWRASVCSKLHIERKFIRTGEKSAGNLAEGWKESRLFMQNHAQQRTVH